ncbi:MAG: hypothetical protein ACOYPR_15875 [Saprospiraceae bacterium]
MNYFDKIFLKKVAGLTTTAPRPLARFEKKFDRGLSQSTNLFQEINEDPDPRGEVSRSTNISKPKSLFIEPTSRLALNPVLPILPSTIKKSLPTNNPDYNDSFKTQVSKKHSKATEPDQHESSAVQKGSLNSNATEGITPDRSAYPSDPLIKVPLPPGVEPRQVSFQSALPPAINISIGRLEIKAIRQEPKPKMAKVPTPPKLSLDKYIADKLNKK